MIADVIRYCGISSTVQQIENCLAVVEEILTNLDDDTLSELSDKHEDGADGLFDDFYIRTFRVLYGDSNKLENEDIKYLTQFSSKLEEELRVNSIVYFALSLLPEIDINWHHIEWSQLLENHNFVSILATRGGGKSWWLGVFNCWKAYRYERKSKDKSRRHKEGFIFSDTGEQAKHKLEIFKELVESSEVLTAKLKPKNSDHWGATEVRLKNGVKIKTKGLGASSRGWHPNWIVVDDPLKDNVIYSEIQRKKAIDDFRGKVLKMLEPDGQIVVIGTPMHRDDLYSIFRDKEAARHWVYREYPAIFPDGRLLWKKRLSLEHLKREKATSGSLLFSREMLCRPITSDSSIFPWNILHKSIEGMSGRVLLNDIDESLYEYDKIITGCDFSISANTSGDFTVFTTWGIEGDGKMVLLNIYRRRGITFNEQINQLKSIYNRFKPDTMVLENNVFQDIYVQFLKNTALPIFPSNTGANKNDYRKGVPSLAVLYERGKIKFPRGNKESRDTTDIILNEFSNFGFTDKGKLESLSGHDDCVMSTWLARLAMILNHSKSFNYSWL